MILTNNQRTYNATLLVNYLRFSEKFMILIVFCMISKLKLEEVMPSCPAFAENALEHWGCRKKTIFYFGPTLDLASIDYVSISRSKTTTLRITIESQTLHTISRGLLDSLTGFEELDFDIPNLLVQPFSFQSLRHLERLSLAYDRLYVQKEFSSLLFGLETLTFFRLVSREALSVETLVAIVKPLRTLKTLTVITTRLLEDENFVSNHEMPTVETLKLYCSFHTKIVGTWARVFPNLQTLEIFDNSKKLVTLAGTTLHPLHKLLRFELAAKLSFVPAKLFAESPSLESVVLHVHVPSLPSALFSRCLRLLFVDLSDNGLEVLPEGLFANNKNLQSVDMNKNHLETLERGTFSGLAKLVLLDLHENRLGRISLDRFAVLPSLQYLNLSYQTLELIDCANIECRNLFPRLQVLNLRNSGLAEENLPKWLRKLIDEKLIKLFL